jgi:hypothetical protein
MSPSRALGATVAAIGAALVLSTHVFGAISLLRIKVVQSPVSAVDGRLRTTTAGFPQVNDLRPPFALISRIHNQSGEVGSFSFAVDGTVVCNPRVPAGSFRRLDCDVTQGWNPANDHVVTIEESPPGSAPWTLESLELATHHGSASGTHYLVVLPGSSDRYRRLSPIWVGVASSLIFVIVAFPVRGSWPPGTRAAYLVLAGGLTVLLAAMQCSQWLTSFRVVLSADTLMLWLALLLAPRLWRAIGWTLRRIEAAGDHWLVVARAGFTALLVFAVYGIVVRARARDFYGGNYSGLLAVSERLFDRNPLLAARSDVRKALVFARDGGYDGQFMYFATFDPLLRTYADSPVMYRQVMDAVPYRYGRIGYSWLTLMFSAGQWERYPSTMVLLILGSLASAAFLLAVMAQAQGFSPALGLLVLAIPGFWQSLLFGLPEPVAAAALLGGVFCLSRARWVAAGLLFALSLLVRETGVVAVGCALVATIVSDRRREALFVGVLAFGVILLWRLYVAWILFPDWGVEGLLYHPPDLGWPLAGIIELWRLIGRREYYSGATELARAGVAYPLLLIGGFILAFALAVKRRSAIHVAALAYACVAMCLNYAQIWVHIGNGQRGTYELFLMLAISSVTMRADSPSLQKGQIAFWSCSIAYVFLLSFDASYIRSALGIPF